MWVLLPAVAIQAQDLRLQYRNASTSSSSQTIDPRMNLYNDGASSVNMTDVTIRYWFTSEPPGQDVYVIYWAQIGAGNINGTFGTIGSNRYLEISFTSGAGSLAGGANTGEMQHRIRDSGWANYTQSDDYSFDASVTSYSDYDFITVYHQGSLVWGTPPSGATEAESMEITQQPTTTTAGDAISPSPTVLLKDGLDNPVEGVEVTVTLNQNNFAGGSTTTVTTNSSGLAVFDDLTIEDAATGYQLTFDADASLVSDLNSNSFNIDPDVPSTMTVSTQPSSSTTAGTVISPSPAVTLTDAYGNPTPNEDVTVSINKNSFASGTATISTNSSGVATFTDLVITTAATGYQLTFDPDPAGVSNKNSTTFAITSASAAAMTVTQQPLESVETGVIAGPPAVKITDTYNNPVSGVNVTVSETGGYTFDGGTLTRSTNSSGVATFNDLQITTVDTGYQLTFDADAGGVSNVNSSTFDVVASGGSMTITTQPTQTVAGTVISPSLTVELEDGGSNPLSGVDITVSLNKNGFDAGTLTKQTNGSGVATFNDLVIETADTNYEITFNADQGGVPNVFSNSFDVIAATAASLSMSTQPANTAAGSSISGPPAVIVSDTYGNPVSGVGVTVSINKNSFASGTTTKSSGSDGIAEFDDLVVTTAATSYQLTFDPDAAGVSNAFSNNFNITAATASSMTITVQPTETTADVVISPSPKVQVTDTYGNLVPGKNITASLNQSSFTGGSTTIVATNSSGIANFGNLKISTVNTGYQVTFSSSGLSSAVSNSFDVIQPNPPFGSITLEYDNNATNTSSGTINPYLRLNNESSQDINLSDLTVRYWFTSEPSGNDQFHADYVQMGSSGDVNGTFDQLEGAGNYYMEMGFSSSAVIPVGLGGDGSTPDLMPAGASTGTIQVRLDNDGAGNYDQSDDYSFDAGITTFTEHEYINVYYKGELVWGTPPAGAAEAESMEITQEPSNTTAGQAISPSPTVLLEDGQENPVEGVDVTVTLNQNNFTGGSTVIVTTNSSGLAVFDNLIIETADTGYEFTFDADASLVSDQISTTFDVSAAAAANMTVSQQPPSSTSAGSTISPGPAVTVTDAYGNPTANEDVTISLNKNSFSSGTLTATTNSSGIASFSDLVITTAATGYQFTFDADAAGVSNKNSNTFIIGSSTATTMTITQQPLESVVSGVIAGPPAVKLTDTYGNAVSGIDVTVSEISGYTFDAGTLTRTTGSSGIASFNDLQITTADNDYQMVFDPDAFGVSNKISNFFDVTAPTGSMTITQQPTQAEAGAIISPAVTIELLDLADDPISGVDITISLNENSFAAGTLTKQTNGSGIATFDDLVIETAGTDYQITFDADQSGVSNEFSDNFDITATDPDAISITSQPGTTPSGSPVSGPPEVTISDEYGNAVSGINVAVTLNQNNFASGTTTIPTNSFGVASFDDLVITTIATGYQLTFDPDAAGLGNTVSNNFNITADAPDDMEITVQPTETTGNITISPYPTVLVTDAGDNPVPGVNVTATLNQNSFTGGSTVIVATNSNGLAVFSNLKIGTVDTSYELSFSASGLSPVVSNPFDIIQPNPPYGSIRLEYNNNSTNTSSATIRPYIRVTNDSDYNITLSELTIRYWFTSEPPGTDQFNAYYVQMGDVSELTSTFSTVDNKYYLEVGFTTAADIPGNLGGNSVANEMPPDASTGVIQMQISDSGGGSYDQSDDYSFDAGITSYTDYDYINVYYKGQLVWGESPAIATKYYSRQTGNWNVATNWSSSSHVGPVSTVVPQAEDTVVIGNENVISFTDNVTNDGSVTIDTDGTLATGSYILSGSGSFDLSSGGTLRIGSADGITSSGATGSVQNTGTRTFDQAANYTYNGSSAQVTGNGLPSQISGNLTINNAAGVRALNNQEVTGTLNLINGPLIISSGNNLIANTKSISSGTLIMEITITGSTGWRLLSSPVATTYEDLLDSTLTQGYPDAYYGTGSNPGDTLQPNVIYHLENYSGTDNQRWRAPSGATASVTEGRGLYTFFFGDIDADPLYNDIFDFPITLTAEGQEFEGDGSKVDFGITYTAAADSGWNLIGNPYASTIDWDDNPSWTKTNIDNTIYVWDPATFNYKTWNGTAGDLPSQGLIAPFQGFWIKANDTSPLLEVTEDAKTLGGTYVGKQARQEESNELPPVISLKIVSGELEGATHFMFSEEASLGKDRFDAYRLSPPPGVASYIDIYSKNKDGELFAINNMPRSFGKIIEIPVYVHSYEGGLSANKEMAISLSEYKNIPEGWEIQLIDNNSRSKVNLNLDKNSAKASVNKNESKENVRAPEQGKVDFKSGKPYNFINEVEAKTPAPNQSFGAQPKIKTSSGTTSPRFTLQIYPGDDASDLPSEYKLEQNYPNPFNPSTTIEFHLPLQGFTELAIFDILGRKVQTLVDGEELNAGTHTYIWNARELASGVYIYRLVTPEAVITKKMTLIK